MGVITISLDKENEKKFNDNLITIINPFR